MYALYKSEIKSIIQSDTAEKPAAIKSIIQSDAAEKPASAEYYMVFFRLTGNYPIRYISIEERAYVFSWYAKCGPDPTTFRDFRHDNIDQNFNAKNVCFTVLLSSQSRTIKYHALYCPTFYFIVHLFTLLTAFLLYSHSRKSFSAGPPACLGRRAGDSRAGRQCS
jgi:hypothetical protein